jgi:hypothetical protein
MATLPSVTVTDQQLNLLMETFQGTFGGPGQPANITEAYRAWLIGMLKGKVYAFKTDELMAEHNATLETALANLRTELNAVIG